MFKFLVIVATLPLLAVTELPQEGGSFSSGSFGGSVPVSSQYQAPMSGSGSSVGFGGYQSSQQAAQGFGLKGQSGYSIENYIQNGIGGYSSNEGYSSGGGGRYNVGSNINGFSHGRNGNGFGQSGSSGHSTETGGGLQSLYGGPGFGPSSHSGSINLQRFPDFTSSLESMSSLVSGAPKFISSYPMIGHFGFDSPLLHNSGLGLGTLTKFGSLPTQFSGPQRQEFHGLPLSVPSTKYELPSTSIPSSVYGVTPGSPSPNYDASTFGLSSSNGIFSDWPSVKIYSGSPGEKSSMYGVSLGGLTSTFGSDKPSLDLTTSGGIPNLYNVPSSIHGTASGGKPSLSFRALSSGLPTSYGTPSVGTSTVGLAPPRSLFNTHGSSSRFPSSTHGSLSEPSTSHGAQWTPLSGPSPSYGAVSGSSNQFIIPSKGLNGHYSAPSAGQSTAYGTPFAAHSVQPDRYGIPSNVLTTPSAGKSIGYMLPSRNHYL